MANNLKATGGYQNLKGYAFISPWIIGFLLFLLVPIVMTIYYSLCDYNPMQKTGPIFIGIENYIDLFHDISFWKSVTVTFKYVAVAVPAGLIVSLVLALLLNMRVPGQAFFRTVIFLPSLVPVVASSMLWLWLYNSQAGLFNTLLGKIGCDSLIRWCQYHGIWAPEWPISWLTVYALPSLIFMSLWGVGQTVVIFLAGLQDVPRELYEAAEIDGASFLRRLWHVTLPMLSPVIFFNLIMALIGTFQVFAVPYSMTSGGPAQATYLISMFVYDNAFRYNKMGYASALGIIQLGIILPLTGIAIWSSKRWVHYQGK